VKLVASLTIIVALLATPVFAQTSERSDPGAENAPRSNPITQHAKARRGSGPPMEEQISGVRPRPKPGASNTSFDTTYHTIIVPSGNAINPTGPANTLGGNQVNGGLQPRLRVQDASRSTLPESMRIQQAADRANPPGPDLITKGGAPSSQVPNVQNSSIEQNRLDTAAPTQEQLQIDDLTRVRPNSLGSTANVVSGSSTGSSTGTSGSGGVAPTFGTISSSTTSPASVSRAASASHSSSHSSSR
jgi:hypothetical protein